MPFCIMRTLSTFSCEYFCSFTEVKIRVCLLCSIWVLQVFPPPVTLCVTAPSSVRQSESQPNTNTFLYLWYTHDSRFDLRLTGDLFCFIFMASNQLFWRRVEFWVLNRVLNVDWSVQSLICLRVPEGGRQLQRRFCCPRSGCWSWEVETGGCGQCEGGADLWGRKGLHMERFVDRELEDGDGVVRQTGSRVLD